MPPVVIAGAIAGAGAIGSAVIGSDAAKSAAKSSQAAADQSAQLQRDTDQQNAATLAPYVQTGNQASGAINALLGLGGTQQVMQPTQAAGQQYAPPNAMGSGFSGIRDGFAGVATNNGQQTGPNYAGYVNANPDLLAEFQRVGGQFGGDPASFGQYHWQTYGQNEGRTVPTFGNAQGATPTANGQASLTPQQTYQSAFDNYRNSTGYQFRLNQGMNALNSGYAGVGAIKSGAAMKAATEYGQNFASGEFNNYLGALGNQQGVGLSAASAQAGVGQNYANNMTSINQNNAANQGNAGLVRASATGQALNSLATIGAGLFNQPSTYSRLTPSAASSIAANPGIF